MIEVVLVVICAIGLYAAWSIVKYNEKVKEQERDNQRRASSPKKKTKTYQSIDELPDQYLDQIYKDFGIERNKTKKSKRKYKSAKKKAIESKVKKNAGRNKKKV